MKGQHGWRPDRWPSGKKKPRLNIQVGQVWKVQDLSGDSDTYWVFEIVGRVRPNRWLGLKHASIPAKAYADGGDGEFGIAAIFDQWGGQVASYASPFFQLDKLTERRRRFG